MKIVRIIPLFVMGLIVIGCHSNLPMREGLPNFSRADSRVWRGAQPTNEQFSVLAKLGCKEVINLRSDVVPGEATAVKRAGMFYWHVPLPAIGRPKPVQVAHLLSILRTAPGPVFIHCRYGCDRTGLAVALYRIRVCGWTPQQALAEAEQHGLSPCEVAMQQFILAQKPNTP